jgi:hypothetical protein
MAADAAPEERRAKLRKELVRTRRGIKNSLENWYVQALSAIDAWDGTGDPPILYGSTIEHRITEYENAIADAMV